MKYFRKKQQKKVELESLKNNQPQQTTLTVDAKSYKEIMDGLYGNGDYNIAKAVKVSDEDSNYEVKEISSGRMVRGYLIDIDRGQDGNYENTVFVDHSVKNPDNITYYNIKEGVQEDFDLTKSPDYPKIGFHPTDVPQETLGNPFIGTVDETLITWHTDPNDPDFPCKGLVKHKFVIFWIIQVGQSWTTTEDVPCS